MYEAKAYPSEGYLLIRLEGMMTMDEAQACVSHVILEGRRMRPGFSIINDIHQARPSAPEVAEVVKTAQVALYSMGAAHVIRIVGVAASANLQFQRIQREAHVGYETHTVRSLDEAHVLHRKLWKAAP
jgi:hypothetical protein